MRSRFIAAAFTAIAAAGTATAQDAPWSTPLPDDQGVRHTITVPDPSSPDPATGAENPRYISSFGDGWGLDGVARLFSFNETGSVTGCTGTLLSTGWDVLTAAHCVTDAAGNIDVTSVNAGFLNAAGGVTSINSQNIFVRPGYGATGSAIDPNDLAIIRLSREADPWMTRYNLYEGNALFETALFTGYGLTGNGVAGAYYSTLFNEFFEGTAPVRRFGFNSWDSVIRNGFLSLPESASPILLSDFDSGAPQHNFICNAWQGVALPPPYAAGVCGAGFGPWEVGVGSGDSGGPGFILQDGELRVAGVASFNSVRCYDPPTDPTPGCQDVRGGYFGGYHGHVSVADPLHASWINATTVPEPGTVVLLATGLAVLGGIGAKRRRAS